MSSVNLFLKARIPRTDAIIAASVLVLAVKEPSFTAKQAIQLAKDAGDQRSDSTLQCRTRELLKRLVEAGILHASQASGRGRKKKYSLALDKETLEQYIPLWLRKYYEEILNKVEQGEITIMKEEEEKVSSKRKIDTKVITLDKFFKI